MTLAERAESTARAVCAALGMDPSPPQLQEIRELMEQSLINAVLEANESCTHAVMECCSPDLDTAHKVAEEIRRRQEALVANLSSMR